MNANRAQNWNQEATAAAAVPREHVIAAHVVFSLCVVIAYFLLNRPEIILVSPDLGFTAWFPATGLVFAVMLSINPRYAPLLIFADALASFAIYHQPLLSWTAIPGSICANAFYFAAAIFLRNRWKIDPTLRHRQDVVRYVTVSSVAAFFATFAGVFCIYKDHIITASQIGSSAVQWFMGDLIGLIGFAPFLLIHIFPWVKRHLSPSAFDDERYSPAHKLHSVRLANVLEAAAQFASILLVLWIMFGPVLGPKEFYFLGFIPVIWVGMRQGIKRVSTTLVFFNFGLVLSFRLFSVPGFSQLKTGLLMLAVSATGLFVGSEVTERQRVVHQLNERTSFLDTLIERNPLAIAIQDEHGIVRFCNDAFVDLFLYDRGEIIGKSLDALIGLPSELGPSERAITPSHGVVRRARKDRRIIDLELHEVSIAVDGHRPASYAIYIDISEQVKSARETREYAESLDMLVTELQLRTMQMSMLNEMNAILQTCSNSTEALTVVTRSVRNILSVSTGGSLFLFTAAKDALQTMAPWGNNVASEPVFAPTECLALSENQAHWSEYPREGVICAHLRHPIAASYLCVPLVAQGETLGLLHVQYDRSESAKGTEAFESLQQSQQRLATAVASQIALSLSSLRLRESLREQSIRDPLTGLFNRRFMQESLDRELRRASRKNRPLSVVFMDLDHFKRFNDRYGHAAGDEVLRTMARALESHFRVDDVICRYGGEEFAVIMPESTAEEAARRTEELCADIKQIRLIHDGKLLDPLSISAGVSAHPQHSSSVTELLRLADTGLYESKAAGRDRVTIVGKIRS
jgi:diguanylate cyclase (GGDEF)-like protein/PAS domain S-box-containing protein